MVIVKTKNSLQLLGIQVLDLCPIDSSDNFVDGYLNFVSIFFDEIDIHSNIFHRMDGAYDVDLDMTLDGTLKTIDSISEKLRTEQKEEFWLGILSASENSQRTLTFAFEIHPTNEAA